MIWKTRRHTLDLSRHAVVMGILNATPDSFSDGGQHGKGDAALAYALEMVENGAEIIDVGGESTRPGAVPVSADEEIARVVPLIRALRAESEVLISIDTSKSVVAEAALEAGADIVNDVTGLMGAESGEAMAEVCVYWGAGVVVMHMQGNPQTMQNDPNYQKEGGVVAGVRSFFEERLATLSEWGVDSDYVCLDPGIGFGKTVEHNVALMKHLGDLQKGVDPCRPLLLGISRKSLIGALTGESDPSKRDLATAVLTALAFQKHGIALHRVHDVSANVQALRLALGDFEC